MTLRQRWETLGFYWQVYLFMAFSFGCVITLVEVVLEPVAESALAGRVQIGSGWGEVFLWALSTLLPSLLMGSIMTRMVRKKLDRMDAATRRLASGDLGARAPESGGANDVFGRLAVSFNEMAETLERLVANEKRLLADISHELRSPLTRMGLAVALLAKKWGGDKNLAVLETEVENMGELVRILLKQGRERILDHGQRQALDLSALVRDIVDSNTPLIENAGKTVRADIEPGLSVWGAPARFRQVLENVLANAVFYGPDGTAIDVRAVRSNGKISVAVRDYGPGVPDKHLQDIFRAFFRIDESRARNSGGAGLGLALAKEAALAMGGDIVARNAGPGLEVTLSLPAGKKGASPPGPA